MYLHRRHLILIAMGLGLMASTYASAQNEDRTAFDRIDRTRPAVITRSGVQRIAIHHPRRDRVELVERRVVEPAAVVSRALSEQPVYLHEVQLDVINTPISVDLSANYTDERHGGLDDNHSIVKAQRIARSLRANQARVVRSPAPQQRDREDIKPIIVIPKPTINNGPGQIPSVPASPEPAGDTPVQPVQKVASMQ